MTTAPGGTDTGPGPAAAPRPGLRGTILVGIAAVAGRLPAGPLVAAADAAGELWYRIAPARRAQARANLQRVCDSLAATGRGTALARRAATDPDAMERLVRACFRHAARYYLEVARTGGFDLAKAIAEMDVVTPEVAREALESGRPMILIGLHFGAIELPVVYVSHLLGHKVTAPMETVSDPGLQHWFVTSRSRVGVNIVPIKDARRTLLRALKRGESVGLVADRDLTGNGIPTPFFGHPAPLAAGPALIAIETGVPMYAAAARRAKDGRYKGRMVRVPTAQGGTRRERVTATTHSMAEVFESLVADAPEQWWGAFHPIWPDLVVGTKEPAHVRHGGGESGAPAGATGPGSGDEE